MSIEQKNISLSYGIHRSPSLGKDGELSECVNLIPRAGELVNIQPLASAGMALTSDEKLLAVHNVGKETHYILNYVTNVTNNATFYYGNNMLIFNYTTDCTLIATFYFKDATDGKKKKEVVRITEGTRYTTLQFATFNPSYDTLMSSVTIQKDIRRSIYTYSVTINYNSGTAPSGDSYPAGNSLGYKMPGGTTQSMRAGGTAGTSETVQTYKVICIGNTVCELTNMGIYYYLWRNGAYTFLGNRIPSYAATPFLDSTLMSATDFSAGDSSDFTMAISNVISGYDDGLVSENDILALYNKSTDSIALEGDVRDNVADRVFGIINTYGEYLSRNGKFHEPFFVRFAYKMYDGSYVMHSAPMLMMPNTTGQPLNKVTIGSNGMAKIDPVMTSSQLMCILNIPSSISNWKDIITSFCVFVSKAIVSYSDDNRSLLNITRYISGSAPKNYYMRYTSGSRDLGDVYDKLSASVRDYMANERTEYELCRYATSGSGRAWMYTAYISHNNVSEDLDAYIVIDFTRTNIASTETITIINGVGELIETPPVDTSTLTSTSGQDGNIFYQSGHTYKWIKLKNCSESHEAIFTVSNHTAQNYAIEYAVVYGPIQASSCFILNMRRTDDKTFTDELINEESFYLAKEYDIQKDLTADGDNHTMTVSIDQGVLTTLTTRPSLTDINQQRITYITDEAMEYNRRLNVAVRRYTLPSCTRFNSFDIKEVAESSNQLAKAFVEVNKNGNLYYKEVFDSGSGSTAANASLLNTYYFAYSDRDASRLLVKFTTNSTSKYYSIPLTQHKTLNLAYAFANFNALSTLASGNQLVSSDAEFTALVSAGEVVEAENVVMQTLVDNPFVMDERTTSLMQSEVNRLSVATKALSQGQFGQFPIIAFCANGIWAISIDSEGKYVASNPISRDVCNNPNTVTQVDHAIAFSTEQGLKLLVGGETKILSSAMDGENISETSFIPSSMQTPLSVMGWSSYLFANEVDDFREMLASCIGIVYDYTNALLRVYPDNSTSFKTYCVDLSTGEFATYIPVAEEERAKAVSIVAGYPSGYVQVGTRIMTPMLSGDRREIRYGWIMTRCTTINEPYALKNLFDLRTFHTNNNGNYTTLYRYTASTGTPTTVYTEARIAQDGGIVYDINKTAIGEVSNALTTGAYTKIQDEDETEYKRNIFDKTSSVLIINGVLTTVYEFLHGSTSVFCTNRVPSVDDAIYARDATTNVGTQQGVVDSVAQDSTTGSHINYTFTYNNNTYTRNYATSGDTISADVGTMIRVAIFASNDMNQWCNVPALKAYSFKYYRFAIFTRMTDYDALSGLTLWYQTRYTGKPR